MFYLIGAVLGLEKSVYYLEKDDCGVGICANISENNVEYATDDQVHIMNYQVTSNGVSFSILV